MRAAAQFAPWRTVEVSGLLPGSVCSWPYEGKQAGKDSCRRFMLRSMEVKPLVYPLPQHVMGMKILDVHSWLKLVLALFTSLIYDIYIEAHSLDRQAWIVTSCAGQHRPSRLHTFDLTYVPAPTDELLCNKSYGICWGGPR